MSKTSRAQAMQREQMEGQRPRDLGVGGIRVEDRVREEGEEEKRWRQPIMSALLRTPDFIIHTQGPP